MKYLRVPYHVMRHVGTILRLHFNEVKFLRPDIFTGLQYFGYEYEIDRGILPNRWRVLVRVVGNQYFLVDYDVQKGRTLVDEFTRTNSLVFESDIFMTVEERIKNEKL